MSNPPYKKPRKTCPTPTEQTATATPTGCHDTGLEACQRLDEFLECFERLVEQYIMLVADSKEDLHGMLEATAKED